VITPADLYYGNLNPNNTTPAPQLLWLGVSPILNSTTDYLISGNVILGTATAPVTVIANRVNFRFAANASLTVNGLFYAGLNTFGAVSYGNFTVNVNGIYVARGNMINAYSQETLNVTYDQNIVNLLQGFNTYAPIPGSWRDF
jgi:hypothetical protein